LIRFIENLPDIALQPDQRSIQVTARFTEVVVERDAPATEIHQRGLDLRAVAIVEVGEQCLAETAKGGAHLHQMTARCIRAGPLEPNGDIAEISGHAGVHDRNVCPAFDESALIAHWRDVMKGTFMRDEG
jgi:hypothetical protein